MGAEEQKNRHEEEEAEKKGDKNTTTNELGAFAQLLRRCSTTLRSMRREFPPNTNVVGSLFLSKKTKDARARVAGLTREMGISRDFDERGSVSRRETRRRGERVGVRVSDFEFRGKGESASERRERRRQRGGDDDV